VLITDNAYGSPEKMIALKKGKNIKSIMETQKSGGWYDFTISIVGDNLFAQRYAGRVETGKHSISDPLMGRVNLKK
jgi:phospholipase C